MTILPVLRQRARNKWRRLSVQRWGRREFLLRSKTPFVSFTFDDFPRTALDEGGRILETFGARGTYYVSSDLLGAPSPSGPIASAEDLSRLVDRGHELGCHTFEHLDGTASTADEFEASIARNQRAIDATVPGVKLSVFAYPLEGPVVGIKRRVGAHFVCCRGGGQSINHGLIDLNLLNGYFLDWKNRGDLQAIRRVIDLNVSANGWLIFATHDVAHASSRYGCGPDYFEAVAKMAVESGAHVLPVGRVCAELGIMS